MTTSSAVSLSLVLHGGGQPSAFSLCYTASMAALFSDTHPKMEALQIELIRSMPAWKKLAIVDGLNETVKTLALSGIRERHPGASPQEIHRLLAELMLGAELAEKVYGHAG